MSDNLRDELVSMLIQTASYRNPIDVADALMPVIRGHLARAWDDAYERGEYDYCHVQITPNPWRKDQP